MSHSDSRAKLPLKVRIERLISEYGRVAVIIYFTVFALVLVGFALAIQLLGYSVDSSAATRDPARTASALSTAGTWGAAWVATKVTQPLRVAATIALTPLVARALPRLRSRGKRAAS